MDGAAVMALQHHFAPLLAIAIAAERIEGCGLGGRGEPEEVMQPDATPDDLLRAAAEPLGQGLIDKQKAAACLDRGESDRNLVRKVEELSTPVPDAGLH